MNKIYYIEIWSIGNGWRPMVHYGIFSSQELANKYITDNNMLPMFSRVKEQEVLS